MILIISVEYDYSTIQVTQWLQHLGVPFFRINGEDSYKVKLVEIGTKQHFIIYNQKEELRLSDVKASWYRRGSINIRYEFPFDISSEIHSDIGEHLSDEIKILEKYFYFLLEQIPHIGTFEKRGLNKLEILYHAKKLSINIPETFIIDNRENIPYINGGRFITKCISEPFMPITKYGQYMTYTEEKESIKTIPQKFFPSLFQTKIEKEADIRVFYINGKFYAMAIMSQNDNQTSTDFRKYLKEKPNRKFPFKLSTELEFKLNQLMRIISLETGSIDLILTKDGLFIFLEVNPVGQFGMTSYPCNYYLEKLIAMELKNIAYDEKR